jgi:hypothetical protein
MMAMCFYSKIGDKMISLQQQQYHEYRIEEIITVLHNEVSVYELRSNYNKSFDEAWRIIKRNNKKFDQDFTHLEVMKAFEKIEWCD